VEPTLFSAETLRLIAIVLLGGMLISMLLAALLFFFAVRKLRRINIPPGAGFGETLLYTPFSLVLFIDLLDWGLDILAAPITWIVLDRLGLRALRNVSTVEALIPFTQPIPTLTLAWIWVRLFGYDSQILDNGDKYIYEQPTATKR
jgi:hypothetical protein